MANEKISQLPAVTNAAIGANSLVPVVDSNDIATKSIEISQLDLRWGSKSQQDTNTSELATLTGSQSAGSFYGGPSSGSGAPSFRAFASSDFPISTIQSDSVINLGLSISVASSLLTVAIKQNDGLTDASASSPVLISFRDSNAVNGDYKRRAITSGLSINTVAVGCTFGLVSGQNQYIYVYAIDNAGIVELALAGSAIFDEGLTYSTTAIGASSTSRTILYSTASRSNVAIRLIGRILSNQVTSGTYTTLPTGLSSIKNRKTFDSEITLDTSNGYGSTLTKVCRFSNVNYSGAGQTSFSYTDSAINGGSIMINEPGLYSVTGSWTASNTGGESLAITLNNSSGAVPFSLTAANRLATAGNPGVSANANDGTMFVSRTRRFNPGDILTLVTQNGTIPGNSACGQFTVTKIGD